MNLSITKENTQAVLKPVVMVGAGVIAVGAIVELYKKVSEKKATATNWIMPAITILVGVSAFSYAKSGEEIRIMPKA